MAIPSEVLRAMVAAGASAEMLIIAVEADQTFEATKKADARAKAAAKKRRQRAEVALQPFPVPECPGDIEGQVGTNGDGEGQAGTAGDQAANLAKENPQTPKENKHTPSPPKGGSVPKGTDRRRGTRIPDGFEQSPEARQAAAELGFVGAAADEALAEFGDYWRPLPGLKATKLDWIGTLRNRLREVARRRPPRTAHGPPGQRLSGPTAATLARKQNRDSYDEPALDLEPVLRPFPARRSSETPPSAGRDDRQAGGDQGRPFEGGVGTVFDLGSRRAHG